MVSGRISVRLKYPTRDFSGIPVITHIDVVYDGYRDYETLSEARYKPLDKVKRPAPPKKPKSSSRRSGGGGGGISDVQERTWTFGGTVRISKKYIPRFKKDDDDEEDYKDEYREIWTRMFRNLINALYSLS